MTINILVKVQPNAGRNEVVGQANSVWKIKIAAPPDKGKANKELVDFLSDLLDIKKSRIAISRGQTSHNKVIEIEGLSLEEVLSRLDVEK
jgi:uncharacterized protein (TIGR00251 family)